MSRADIIQTNFTAGELSPLLAGRIDVSKYYNGVKTLENFVIMPWGGVTKTPGTYFVAEVKDSTKKVRLIPFQFSTEQAYILEFGHQYIRFYMNGGQILDAGVPYEIASPYLEEELFDIQFAQEADVMYLVHPKHKTQKLSRTGHTSWSLNDYSPTSDPFVHNSWAASTAYSEDDYVIPTTPNGYYYRCITAGTSGSSEPIWPTTLGETVSDGTVTWRCESDEPVNFPSCVTIYEQRLWFAATKAQPQTIWASKSGEYGDMTQGSADDDALEYTIGSEQVNAIKWLSAGRILVLGTAGGGFGLTSGSGDPITPTNVIVKRETTFGTLGIIPQKIGNFVYYVQRNGKTIREFAYSFDIDAYQALDMTILAEHICGDGIVQMDYQQSPYNILWCVRSDGQIATLTRQIEHEVVGWSRQITDGKFESVAVIPGNNQDDEVWFVVKREINGSTKRYVERLMPIDYNEQEDCFYVHSGLSLDDPKDITGATQAKPVVVTCPSHGFSNGDIVIIRNINGMTELNKRKFKIANITTDTFELQDLSGNDIDGSPYNAYESGGEARKCVDTLSGLLHLEGETVVILADGAVHPPKTVNSGSISLEWKAGEIHVGLPYTSRLQTMRLEAGGDFGTAQGIKKKIFRAISRLYKSLGGKVGNLKRQDELYFRTTSDKMDEPIPLYEGDKEIAFPSEYNKDAYILITHNQPLPLTVLSIIARLETYAT
jgi:hypothetical protein